MPRNGAFSLSVTPIHSVSVRMNSSLSLALIGPPNTTAPQWSAMVCGQRLAEARLADVEMIAVAHEPLADMARIGILLMQHDHTGFLAGLAEASGICPTARCSPLVSGDWVSSILLLTFRVAAATVR